jgi:hypothetical protein
VSEPSGEANSFGETTQFLDSDALYAEAVIQSKDDADYDHAFQLAMCRAAKSRFTRSAAPSAIRYAAVLMPITSKMDEKVLLSRKTQKTKETHFRRAAPSAIPTAVVPVPLSTTMSTGSGPLN